MFLLHIQKNKKINFNPLLRIKLLIKKLKHEIFFLKQSKEKKELKNFKLLSQTPTTLIIQNNVIEYIISISLSKTNILIYFTDIKGQLKLFCSANTINFSGKQQTKKPLVLRKLLKLFIKETKFVTKRPVALHLKNFNKYYKRFPLDILKTHFFIKVIKNYNLQPHNGCRPRKLKRKSNQKVFFK